MNLPLNLETFPDFSNITKIGNGSYGSVYSAVHSKMGLEVAIKMVDKITLVTEVARKSFHHERTVNMSVDHPFIAHFYRELNDPNATYLLMELADGGCVLDHARARGRFSEQQLQKFLCEILSVLNYLHTDKHIVHRDLKLENILLDDSGNIRVIDFGLSGQITEERPLLNEQCGTFFYMAPEVLKHRQYSFAVDLWSVGVNAYALVQGCFPFLGGDVRELHSNITKGGLKFPVKVSRDCESLIRGLLEIDPNRRLTIEQIAAHPFIRNSRYAFYLSDEFKDSPKYKVIPSQAIDVDKDVVIQVRQLGIDCGTITEDLLGGRDTDATLCYKILKKEKVMKVINSPDEIRSRYGRMKLQETVRSGGNSATRLCDLTPKPRMKAREQLCGRPLRTMRTIKSQTLSPECLPRLKQGL